MSKGSAPRPLSVKKQEFDEAWDKAFGVQQGMKRVWKDGKISDEVEMTEGARAFHEALERYRRSIHYVLYGDRSDS